MYSWDHDYSQEMSIEKSAGGGKRGPPATPTKQQTPKKNKSEEENSPDDIGATTKLILEEVKKLSVKFDMQEKRMDEISAKLEASCAQVTKLTTVVTEYQDKTTALEDQVVKLKAEINVVREKCKENERYKRRWNLRIRGLKEQENEDVKGKVISILSKIAPGVSWDIKDNVDSVHRIGRREPNRTRQVIIQFVKRECRDTIWSLTKDCEVCKKEGISFAEDMIKEDREARMLVWPKMREARRQNKRAYYRGPHAFIDGVKIFP